MFTRRWLVRTALAAAVTLFPGWMERPSGPSAARGAERTASLKDQLTNGLRATRPEQHKFIERVVALVDSKQLSLKTVNAAFKWARERRPDYPFPFFERALRILASREGVDV